MMAFIRIASKGSKGWAQKALNAGPKELGMDSKDGLSQSRVATHLATHLAQIIPAVRTPERGRATSEGSNEKTSTSKPRRNGAQKTPTPNPEKSLPQTQAMRIDAGGSKTCPLLPLCEQPKGGRLKLKIVGVNGPASMVVVVVCGGGGGADSVAQWLSGLSAQWLDVGGGGGGDGGGGGGSVVVVVAVAP